MPCALALLALLAWNDWAGRRLIQARDLLDADALRRFNTGGGESPLAALTREVAGGAVAGVVEAVFFVLMFGVAVAYLVALHDFVRATPLAMPLGVDVALAAAAAVPLALVDDFGSLAAAGAAALVALACSLAAIALYGVLRRERLGWAQSGTFDWTKPDSVADVGAAVGVMACVEINQCVGCTKSFLGDDAAVLAPSSGEEPASPRHRAGGASMAWRLTRRISTNAP